MCQLYRGHVIPQYKYTCDDKRKIKSVWVACKGYGGKGKVGKKSSVPSTVYSIKKSAPL